MGSRTPEIAGLHKVLSILLGHNRWATRALLEGCAGLSREQWGREFEIGCGSLAKTMTHIVGAMIRWAERIDERPLMPSIEDDGKVRSVAELLVLLDAASSDLERIAARIEDMGGMDGTIGFAMPDGSGYRFTKGAALAHVLTHGVHHRAQALNIRRRLGLEPFGLDLDAVEFEAVMTGQLKG